MGGQALVARVSGGPVVADTFAGRIHVEWDNTATVTPLGQLPFFIEYLKQGGLFDGWVADCPLHYLQRDFWAARACRVASRARDGRDRNRASGRRDDQG
jgi:hypothetical protein